MKWKCRTAYGLPITCEIRKETQNCKEAPFNAYIVCSYRKIHRHTCFFKSFYTAYRIPPAKNGEKQHNLKDFNINILNRKKERIYLCNFLLFRRWRSSFIARHRVLACRVGMLLGNESLYFLNVFQFFFSSCFFFLSLLTGR